MRDYSFEITIKGTIGAANDEAAEDYLLSLQRYAESRDEFKHSFVDTYNLMEGDRKVSERGPYPKNKGGD